MATDSGSLPIPGQLPWLALAVEAPSVDLKVAALLLR